MIGLFRKVEINKYLKLRYLFFVFLVSLYSNFSLYGENLFFYVTNVNLSYKNLLILTIGSFLGIPIILLILCYLDYINKKIEKYNYKIKFSNYAKLFLVTLTIWSMYLIIGWPGIITPDTISQHLQAVGTIPFSNHHNIFHTLILRFFYKIYDNYTFVIFLQIVFASSIWALVIGSLSNKIHINYLIVFSIFFSAIPSNAQTICSLWKDIPYAFSLLLLIFVLSKTEINFFRYNYALLFILSFVLVALLRHNGVIVSTGTLLYYLFIAKYKRLAMVLTSIILGIFFFIQFPVMNYYNVKPIEIWTRHITMYNDLVGVIVANGKLSPKTRAFIEKNIPVDKHMKIYTPYIPYMYYSPKIQKYFGFNDADVGLNEISTAELFSMYINTISREPALIIQNRLLSADILWNCSLRKEYNPESTQILTKNVNNNRKILVVKENKIKHFARKIRNDLLKSSIYIVLFQKAGIYLLGVSILFLFTIVNKNKRMLIIFIPIILQSLGLLLSIQAQDYRYVWPIFVSFWFILMYCLTQKSNFK